jgi:hypothetical protein
VLRIRGRLLRGRWDSDIRFERGGWRVWKLYRKYVCVADGPKS